MIAGVESAVILHTDEHCGYWGLDKLYSGHKSINHSAAKYSVDGVTSNSIESLWTVLKRMLHGVYHHASAKRLGHYVNKFAFRLNQGDVKRHIIQRIESLIDVSFGSRLTYNNLKGATARQLNCLIGHSTRFCAMRSLQSRQG